ncbi:MAG: Rieske (2Fe-2S) iron-sulfur domain protein [Solirubrobacterales bacterium]|nr:Rieske (2Fe-2S) iron-sulfur domain protein [Solirubrobacterales bacterium]
MPGSFEGETITRRRLMTGTAHGMGALAAGAIGLPAIGFAIGPVFKRTRAQWEAVGRADGFDENTVARRMITTTAGIGEAGRTTVYVRKRNPAVDTEPGDRFNRFVAISSRCAHVGCPVNYVPASQRFICPCHGGVYDVRGVRTGGPPPRPLDRFYTRVRQGLLEIGPRFSVNSELQRFSPRDPGESLDGIGQYLYPARLTTAPSPR